MFKVFTEYYEIEFETIEEAKQFADHYFKSFGIVLGIEEVKDNG